MLRLANRLRTASAAGRKTGRNVMSGFPGIGMDGRGKSGLLAAARHEADASQAQQHHGVGRWFRYRGDDVVERKLAFVAIERVATAAGVASEAEEGQRLKTLAGKAGAGVEMLELEAATDRAAQLVGFIQRAAVRVEALHAQQASNRRIAGALGIADEAGVEALQADRAAGFQGIEVDDAIVESSVIIIGRAGRASLAARGRVAAIEDRADQIARRRARDIGYTGQQEITDFKAVAVTDELIVQVVESNHICLGGGRCGQRGAEQGATQQFREWKTRWGGLALRSTVH